MQARAEPVDPAPSDSAQAPAGPVPVRVADLARTKLDPGHPPKPVEADVVTTAALGNASSRGANVPAALFEHKSLIDRAVPLGGKAAGGTASLAAPKIEALVPATRQLEGKWAANTLACASGRKRTGHLPLTIDGRGASAGGASCSFGKTEQDGNRWVIAAQCRQAGKSWDANVQLVLKGRQLTWTSRRGTQTYTRCL
jgi:hypothetical protein